MHACCCADGRHDIATPEGLLEHMLVLAAPAMPPAGADAYRQLLVSHMNKLRPFMHLAVALACQNVEQARDSAESAHEALRLLTRELRSMETELRALETLSWMREAEGKR